MSFKNLVTQGELDETITGLDALVSNLDEHVNQSLSKAHGWSILDNSYLDTGGNYHTDVGNAQSLVSIPGLFSTGVNDDGTLAAPGSVDSHWTLIQSPDSTWRGPAAYILPVSSYPQSGPIVNAQWINPTSSDTGVSSGTYKYRISFNLTGLNPSTAIISGTWQSDNQTVSILLNGLVTGYSLGDSSWTAPPQAKFQLTGPFLPGINTLDFVVNNISGPSALRVELTSIASSGGATAIPGIYSTGVNNDGTFTAYGGVDEHWTLLTSPDSTNPGPNAIVSTNGPWVSGLPTAQRIGPRKDGSGTQGQYVYRLSFDLTGYAPSTALLKGYFQSDDAVWQVLLNQQVTGIANGSTSTSEHSSSNSITSFVISSGFNAGVNTLDFYLFEGYGPPTGLAVAIAGLAAKSGTNITSRVLRLTIGGNVFYIPAQASGGMDGTPDPAIPSFSGIVSPQSADPASDLTAGSPTPAELVTTFAAILNAISDSASNALFQHAGSPAESVHGGLSWQQDSIVTTGGYVAGRRTVNLMINGVQYKLVADTNLRGPLNS